MQVVYSVVNGTRGVHGVGGRTRFGRWEAIEEWDPGYTLFVDQDGGFEVLFEEDTGERVTLWGSIFDGVHDPDVYDHVTGISRAG